MELDGEDDHVHLLVHYPPKFAVSLLVNSLEGGPVVCWAISALISASAIGKAGSGRPVTSFSPAAKRPSASCANTSNSRRFQMDSHDRFAVSAILGRPEERGLPRVPVKMPKRRSGRIPAPN